MRGLSFTPPWPFAIFRCGKNIENRQGWETPAYTACREYRGPIAIHASRLPRGVDSWWKRAQKEQSYQPRESQAAALDEFLATFDGCHAAAQAAGIVLEEPVTLRTLCSMTGHIVGTASVVGAVERGRATGKWMVHERGLQHARELTPSELRWWMGGFALVLDDVIELATPIPCKGALGLWPLPTHVAEQLARAA